MGRKFCTKCPRCRERTVRLQAIPYTIQFDYDGRKHIVAIPELIVPQCSKCGRISIDHEADQQIETAFRQQVGLLAPEEIRAQREAAGLTQEELADKLKIAAATLSRWETGAQMQQRSLDLLMRLFFKNPGAWQDLEQEARSAVGENSTSAPVGRRFGEVVFGKDQFLEASKLYDETASLNPGDYLNIFGDLNTATGFVDVARSWNIQQIEKN